MINTNPQSKLFFPSHMSETMDQVLEFPMTIFEAPMGYGKTTVVKYFLKQNRQELLWQNVYNDSLQGFWLGFCQAIQKLDNHSAKKLEHLGFPSDSISLYKTVEVLKNITTTKEVIYVIDDYHIICCDEVNRFIEFLTKNEISDLYIVLITRYTEFMNIEELALKGFLLHITKNFWEFKPQDIQQYFHQSGIGLKMIEAQQLFEITEGWISALYLMMLDYKKNKGEFTIRGIYKLVDQAIYQSLSQELKQFLMMLCIQDSFTIEMAEYIHNEGTELLQQVISINAFTTYNEITDTYQIHSIFKEFLKERFHKQDESFQQQTYQKGAMWLRLNKEYRQAILFFYKAQEYDYMLKTMSEARFACFDHTDNEQLIKYINACPDYAVHKHPKALLSYAMHLMTCYEMDRFEEVCTLFATKLECNAFQTEDMNQLVGEFELLLSFTKYNDIEKMSEHQIRASNLITSKDIFMDTSGSWTFGSPSVLYLFHRETGTLDNTVSQLNENLSYYTKMTSGHGQGCDYILEAEYEFNRCHIEEAEIILAKVKNMKPLTDVNTMVCALFVEIRIALYKGQGDKIDSLFEDMNALIDEHDSYELIHSVDLCRGFVYSNMNLPEQIPNWLQEGNLQESKLYYQAYGFANIVFGKSLLLNKEYLSLIGHSEGFYQMTSMFSNILGTIYTDIYMAIAYECILRREDALRYLQKAILAAIPDKIYMPFIENYQAIMDLLKALKHEEIQIDVINVLITLGVEYSQNMNQLKEDRKQGSKPLTPREKEVALYASEGYSNKHISTQLFISENTVKKHLKSVFEKLNISSRALLIHYLDKI